LVDIKQLSNIPNVQALLDIYFLALRVSTICAVF